VQEALALDYRQKRRMIGLVAIERRYAKKYMEKSSELKET
jgi:hypothetical protein